MNVDHIFKTERRTWRERLFTRPWNPFRATKQVRDFEAETTRDRWQAVEPVAPVLRLAGDALMRLVPKPAPWPPAVDRGHVPLRPVPSPEPAPADDSIAELGAVLLNMALAGRAARVEPEVITEPIRSGGGGDFGGAGATGSWDAPAAAPAEETDASDDDKQD